MATLVSKIMDQTLVHTIKFKMKLVFQGGAEWWGKQDPLGSDIIEMNLICHKNSAKINPGTTVANQHVEAGKPSTVFIADTQFSTNLIGCPVIGKTVEQLDTATGLYSNHSEFQGWNSSGVLTPVNITKEQVIKFYIGIKDVNTTYLSDVYTFDVGCT